MGLYIRTCPKCEGTGTRPRRVFSGTRECARCEGRGSYTRSWYVLWLRLRYGPDDSGGGAQ